MSRPLKIFMRGKKISQLQELLKRMGYPMQDQPGLFGVHTRDAVKAYQKQRGLKATGEVSDELLLQMQQGGVAPSTATSEKKEKQAAVALESRRADALIRLLISKGVITEEELQAELKRPQPLSITQPPLT